MKLQNESSDMVIGPDGKPVKVETVSVINGALASSQAAAQADGAVAMPPDADAAVAANQQLKDEEAASKAEPPAARDGDGDGDVAMPDQPASSAPDATAALTSHPPAMTGDDAPHARGPDAITAADTGKVTGSGAAPLDFAKAAGKAAAEAAPSDAPDAGAPSLKRSADAAPDVEGAAAAAPKLRARTRSQSVHAAREDAGRRRGRRDEGEGRASLASAPPAVELERMDALEESEHRDADAGAAAQKANVLAAAAADARIDSAVEGAGVAAGAGAAAGVGAAAEGRRLEEMGVGADTGGDGAADEAQGRGTGRQGKSGNVDEDAMEGTEAVAGDSTTKEDSEQRNQRDTEMTEG